MPYNTPKKKRDNQKRYYHSTPERRHAHMLGARIRRWERKYKISEDKMLAMLDEQKDLCAACGQPFGDWFDSMINGGIGLVPTLDHDRSCCPNETSCGRCIRGIVHHRCNVLFGIAKENPEVLRRCADYLERIRST